MCYNRYVNGKTYITEVGGEVFDIREKPRNGLSTRKKTVVTLNTV
jgi:hypothetical protein